MKNHPLAKHANAFRIFFQCVTLGFVLVAVVVVAISLFRSSDADNITRFCFQATPGAVVGGAGEAGALLYGELTLDTNTNSVSYYAQDNGAISTILSLVIRGPQLPGTSTGVVLFSLCGAPNLDVVCDVTSLPGVVQGSATQLEPGDQDPLPIILQMREHPSLYYLEVLTASNPASPGALRAALDSTCGFA